MARKKQPTKAKEPIKIRLKKLANGNQSIYLDIYEGEGKPRLKEYLKLYIIPEVDNAARITNANTMQVANAIKAERIIEIANGKAGIKTASARSKMLLLDWMREFERVKMETRRYGAMIDQTIKHLIKYRGEEITMQQIDPKFWIGFFQYLDACKNKGGQPLSDNTKYNIYLIISGALNMAVQKDVLMFSPLTKLTYDQKPHPKEGDRAFLTIDEIKTMINGRCRSEVVKRAFLFACFCGFRYGDIEALTWGQITKDGKQWRATITMQKTGRTLHQPLSDMAMKWLPERGAAGSKDKIFDLPHKTNVERMLGEWAFAANIEKKVTFHVSRHTFATLNITAGADIYTTSKLMGHTNVKTTQIYAKIVDKKKDEAINAVSNLFK